MRPAGAGVVWKTLGEEGPPIVNVNGPRYGVVHGADRRVLGLNNIELITDRPLEVNLREIKAVKRDYADRAMVVSIMVPCEEAAWRAILPRVEETGADGIELNFGCPHGMSERGMGSAVGQVPDYVEMVARWCKAITRMPVIVKLTPNITDVRHSARAAARGGADAVSLINTINSITSVDLDLMAPEPTIDGKGTHGGYCGPAVKPIALHMVADIARDPECRAVPISGIGGVTTWRDAAEFLALGAGNVQVCTAAMTYGFGIIKEMTAGLSTWMDEKTYSSVAQVSRRAVPNVTDWQYLNLEYVTKARIDQALCIKCGRCYAACEDTSPPGHRHRAGADLRGDRRRVRGLQPVRGRLSGGGLHHHDGAARRQRGPAHGPRGARRARELDEPSEQPGRRRRRIGGDGARPRPPSRGPDGLGGPSALRGQGRAPWIEAPAQGRGDDRRRNRHARHRRPRRRTCGSTPSACGTRSWRWRASAPASPGATTARR